MTADRPLFVVQPYLRVSTDDKGQDPARQMRVIEPWGLSERVGLLPPIVDEGTSADKTSPFERPKFMEAVEIARFKGAKGILVETGDRFTRRGTRHFFYYAMELEKEYGLKLFEADQTLVQQESGLGEIMSAMRAQVAKEWMDTHKRRAREGAARRKAAGLPMGRPAKPFSPAEESFMLEARARQPPMAWRQLANKLCEMRGAFRVVDEKARERRMVSDGHVRRWIRNHALADLRVKSTTVTKPQEST